MSPAIRNYVLLFFGCLVFHLAGTWSLPLIDRDEPRFAEAAREMRARGDFVVPYFNNDYRFDKPPLTYWFQVVSYGVFGENDFAARFPTTIAAALTAVILFEWGKRLRDHRTGWWAALIFTVCLQTFVHAKAAVADMWLVLFVTLAHRAGWEFIQQQASNFKAGIVYYFSLALAFLAKGPIGFTPLLTALWNRFRRPRSSDGPRPHLRTVLAHAGGLLLMLALISAWGIPALVRTHGEFWNVGIGKHVIARSVATMEGHGSSSPWMYLALLPFYFVTVFASLFPWSLKLPALIKNLRAQADETDRYLLSGALIIFLIFSLVKTKLPHYTLPAFPLLSLLLARRATALRLSRTLAGAAAVALLFVALIVPPILARKFPAYDLARQSAPALPPQTTFASLDFAEPSLVWYFRKYLSTYMTTLRKKDAASYLQENGPRLLILPTEMVAQALPSPDPHWRQWHTRGFNVPKGQSVDLTLLLKPN